jgi:hypothetical protein
MTKWAWLLLDVHQNNTGWKTKKIMMEEGYDGDRSHQQSHKFIRRLMCCPDLSQDCVSWVACHVGTRRHFADENS